MNVDGWDTDTDTERGNVNGNDILYFWHMKVYLGSMCTLHSAQPNRLRPRNPPSHPSAVELIYEGWSAKIDDIS